MRRQLVPPIISMVIFTVLLGLVFPLVVLGIGQLAFHDKANGSIIERNGKAVGSSAHRPGVHRQEGQRRSRSTSSRGPRPRLGANGSTRRPGTTRR